MNKELFEKIINVLLFFLPKNVLQGYRTIILGVTTFVISLIGLFMGPEFAHFLASIGVESPEGFFKILATVSGFLMVILRVVTETPVGEKPEA